MAEIKKANEVKAVSKTSEKHELDKSKKVQFSAFIKSNVVQNSLESTLGSLTKAKTFTANLISAVSTNPNLRECEASTLISSALLGEALKLSPSPQLGQFYIVPFKDNSSGITKATFQLGWKGYYQLALRSGQYKNIDVVAIKEGELNSYNPVTGELNITPLKEDRENAKTIGYYAFFELVNGFKKSIYWSVEKMKKHAETYSMGYRNDLRKGTKYTFWSKQFDEMAIKTLYRQLIGKYGIMSIDMQKAFINDMTIQDDFSKPKNPDEEQQPIYFDNVIDSETGEVYE